MAPMLHELKDEELPNFSKNFEQLEKLNIADNQIKNFKTLKSLKSLKNLEELSSQDNPVSETEDYSSEKIFEMLPNLGYLDNHDKEGN